MNTVTPPIALAKLVHQGIQQGKMALSVVHKDLSYRLFSTIRPSGYVGPELDASVIEIIQERITALVDEDWRDGEQGVYPVQLLFDEPWGEYLQIYPWLCLDSYGSWNRLVEGRHYEFAPSIDVDKYPKYYARNFHNQTDGYLSDASARLYDLQVEILFSGMADPMRRRVIKPLKAGLDALDVQEPRILDIACGTGCTLRNLKAALPEASFFGLDLSPNYLRRANEVLSRLPNALPQLAQGNAEALPYLDGYFHGVTNVFLFHEIPGPIRQRIINESYRVLAPGGVCVICDSIQQDDLPALTPVFQRFAGVFHEPFFVDYIKDDIEGRCQAAGFEVTDVCTHFMSKYWVLRKPV